MTRDDVIEAMSVALRDSEPGKECMSPLYWKPSARAAFSAIEAMGVALVPVTPTVVMVNAGHKQADDREGSVTECIGAVTAKNVYRAMLASSPLKHDTEDEVELEATASAVRENVRQWQPIETAPNDNTEIIGLQGMTVEIIRFIPALGYWYNRDENISLWQAFPPTHWMPLPASPSGQIEETALAGDTALPLVQHSPDTKCDSL